MPRDRTPVRLHRAWIASIIQLVAIVVGLAAVALAVTSYSRSVFQETTAEAEQQMSALAAMRRSLIAMSEAATPVMYAFDGDVSPAEQFARYDRAAANLTAELAAARATFSDATSSELMEYVTVRWNRIDTEVRGAPELWASGEAGELLSAARDPFETSVWAPYREIETGLSLLGDHATEQLRLQIDEVDRVHNLIAPAVLAALLLALGMSWGAARRLSRRVIQPLEEVRTAATEMRAARLDRPLELTDAVMELHDLADAINETATVLRSTHDLLRDQAETDPLTGLPNRRALIELLEHELDSPTSDGVAVLFIDLDDFKIVNDTLGHAAGDELLRIVARRLRSVVRDEETVARLGGDEFAIIVRGAPSTEDATALARRVLAALAERVVIDGTAVPVACSVGIARSSASAGADDVAETLRNADFAMYMAKSQGKNRFELFAPTMYAEVTAATELKRDLGQAVHLQQMVLEYQPIVDLTDHRLLGFEALVRWRHPVRGLLPPAAFIPLAEDTADIIAIGRWVLDEACRALAEHHRSQDPGEPIWMSVNVSPVEIGAGLVESVRGALERHGIPARSLMIEITEGVAMAHTEDEALALQQLRDLGVHVALDDFGTGFGSLRSLHDLPVDAIKIDRSFLRADAARSGDSMLGAIVALGRSLGLQIIAEGIETTEDLDRVNRLGIAGQGFLFARPMSPDAATTYRENATRHVPVRPSQRHDDHATS